MLGRVCPTAQSLLRVVAALAPVRAACGLPPHEDEAVGVQGRPHLIYLRV